jgi:hypothetical protein
MIRPATAAVAARAVERGSGLMEWTAHNWNEPALRFYGALRAVAVDDRTVYRLIGSTREGVGGEGKQS